MFKYAVRIMIILAVLTFLNTGALNAAGDKGHKSGKTLKARKSGPGKTVFDLAHAEIFSPVEKGELDYSTFHDSFSEYGEVVTVSGDEITPRSLSGVKTYILAGPSIGLLPEEVVALNGFVKNGGNLLVLLHISGPVARLTESFGIIVSNFVISEPADNIDGQSQDFYVSRLAPHPLTAGVKRIAVFGTWGLLTEKGALTVASTSDKAWADLNRNRSLEDGEPVQSFGIVAASEFGKGKVVVVADDAPFANKFIGQADNKKFTGNIISWFKQ